MGRRLCRYFGRFTAGIRAVALMLSRIVRRMSFQTPAMSDDLRPLIVAKFGGTSVADAARIEGVCKIVSETAADNRLIVVVSALGGMTDALADSIDNAITRSGQPSESVAALVDRYEKAATHLLPADSLSELFAVVNQHWADLGELLDGIFLLRECTPRTRDAVMAIGELVNAPLVAAALAAREVPALPVDARELIRTDDNFGEANVDIDASHENIRRWFENFPPDRVAVVTGFVASTANKVTSTLGRSGSDYTATLIGGTLDAKRVEIWTDVDGVMSADPRVVKDAYTIEELSYVEAGEMAYFGAKVLHPRTMRPLIARSISLHIKNTFNPSAKGTTISKSGRPSGGMVKAITSVRNVAVLMIEGTGMAGVPGVSARAFMSLAARDINVLMISQASSEQSICIVVTDSDVDAAVQELTKVFELELSRQDISRIHAIRKCAVISAVGDRMRHKPGLAGRMFSSLGRCNVNILAIAQGASETNISAVVDDRDVKPALTTLHSTFARGERHAHVFMFGAGGVANCLLDLLKQQERWLSQEQRLFFTLVGIANSRSVMWSDTGIALDRAIAELDGAGETPSTEQIVDRLLRSQLDRMIVVDATASDYVANAYPRLLGRGIAVVAANKKANSSSQEFYREVMRARRDGRAAYLYETTVGAALPVLTTIRDLVDSGDEIIRIRAVLSGTLAFLFNAVSSGSRFSEAVETARAKGITEPDPREDLRGADVRRKLVIMAREMGLELEPSDVLIEQIIAPGYYEGSIKDFTSRLPELDNKWRERADEAATQNARLQFVGEVSREVVAGRVERVPIDSPFGILSGTDNLFVFETRRHEGNPFVVRGPGAGPETTAGGVLSDMLIAARTMK